MPLRTRLWDATGGRLLAQTGRAGRLTTIGRRSGQPRTIQCGFARMPDGAIIVGSAVGRQWPENLAAAGWCRFEAKDLPAREYDATPLTGRAREEALTALRGALGSRGSSMYSGRVFELRPR